MPVFIATGAATVSATPDPSGLPGSNVLQQIVNGADAWALAITLLARSSGRASGRSPHIPAATITPQRAAWPQSSLPQRRL